ncbi:hypothetical protein QE152_g33996 [Popillia japonica]|uniref:Uncharacterized protein n=1 Tax=Popillia japonica TaxID=7064 RepID=A0AAW1IUD3_POPJA
MSDYKRIFIQKKTDNRGINTTKVQCYQNFRFASMTPRNLLKKGKTFSKILKEIELGRTLPDKKKRTIRHLIEQQFGTKWEEDKNLDWYRKILCNVGMDEPKEDEDTNIHCDCLEDDVGVHI